MLRTAFLNALILLLSFGAVQAGSVHDIHLYTDSTPDYVSIEDFVATATSVWDDPEDQAIAFWRWVVRGRQQITPTREDGVPLWDPMQFFPSYPNTNCGYVASFMTAFAEEMGGDWRHRYVELSDHTVVELSWDAGATWHMFDTSMVVFARRHDGQIASCTDISQAHACALSSFWGDPGAEAGHYYLYHATPETMTNPPAPGQQGDLGYPSGYRKAADNPIPYARTLRNGADSYTHGLWIQEDWTHVRTGWRNRLHARPGHTYTRFWTELGGGSEYARLNGKGNDPNDGYFTNGIRGNGRWEIEPGFDAADPAAGWFALSGFVHRDQDGGAGPTLRPGSQVGQADAVLKVDSANVITSGRVYLAGARGSGDGMTFEVSRDAGCSWTTAATLPVGSFAGWYDLASGLVGGATELLVRVRIEPDATRLDCGLDEFRVEAVTSVNALTLPRLQRGANRVRFRSGLPRETLTLRPAMHSGAAHPFTGSADSWDLVTGRDDPGTYSSPVLVPSFAGVEGQVTWRFDTPTDITGATLGGAFITRTAGPGDFVALGYSWDGINFTTPATFDATDAPTYDARLFAPTGTAPAGRRSVWLRYTLESSTAPSATATGIQDALMTVQHEPHDGAFAPVEVTYAWTEHRTGGDVARTHTRVVNSELDTWEVHVGGFRDPTMDWVRVRLADGSSVEGYGDGIDVGPGAGYDKVKITGAWLDDVAFGAPYTVSRPSAALNPDTGGTELTDGVVIPPVDEKTTSRVQGQVAYWEGDAPVTVTVDLGTQQTIAALRVTSHQPDALFGHAGTITATAIGGTGAETALGVIQHDDVWSPTGDHLDWGYGRVNNFPDLPAGARLAHGYWLVFDQPVSAEQVRLEVLPLAGRGVGLSEIQVFSQVSVTDWPDREVDLGDGVSASPLAESGPMVPARLSVFPNPANPGTHVAYELPRGGPVKVRIVDVRGRLVRVLAEGYRPAGSHRAFWDGRDAGGRAMASGVYLAVAEWAGGQAVGRLALVR